MNNKNTIIALNLAIYFFMFGVGLITPLLPAKIFSFSGSTVQVGGLASSFAFSYILFQVPVGILADKYSYKHFITFGYFICGLSGMIYLLADSSTKILVGRFIQGIGEAPLWALAPALLSILKPASKAIFIGWYNASLHIGLTSGSIFCLGIHNYVPQKYVFGIFISLCIISGICVLFFVDDDYDHGVGRKNKSNTDIHKVFHIIQDYRLLCVLLGITIYGVGYGAYLTIIPSYMLKNNQFNQESVGWLFIGFYIGISIAQLVGGYIADTWGRVSPMIGGLLLFSCGQLLFSYFTTRFAVGFLSIASFGLGLFLIGSMATLNDQVGKNSKGIVSGIFYLFWGVGFFLGPLLLGYLGEQGQFIQGFTALGIIGGIIGIILLVTNSNTIRNDEKIGRA